MKITVDRSTSPEGNLVFTVTVKDPRHTSFGEEEAQVMRMLDTCKINIQDQVMDENKIKLRALEAIHQAKEDTFLKIIENLQFSIENEFRPKFKPICQEIYNWIFDAQTDFLKKYLNEFAPGRERYYFDNDPQMHKVDVPQESEHDDEDDEDEDDL